MYSMDRDDGVNAHMSLQRRLSSIDTTLLDILILEFPTGNTLGTQSLERVLHALSFWAGHGNFRAYP